MRSVYLVVRRIEASLLAVAMIAIAGVTIVNVIARNLTGEGLAFAEEVNQLLIVVVCFVGISYAAGQNRHIRMTALSDALPVPARRLLMVFVFGTTAVLLFVLSWYALCYALSVDRRSPVLNVPLGRIYLLAPVGLALGGAQYALAAYRNLRGPEVYASFDHLDGYEDFEPEAVTEPTDRD